MNSYKIFEIHNNEYEYKYNLQVNNINNANIQKEQEKKIDTLLNGILENNSNNINRRRTYLSSLF